MIEVRGLVKTYGAKRAVDGMSFKVRRGDILGFLGPNGAGKLDHDEDDRRLPFAAGRRDGARSTASMSTWPIPSAVKRRLGVTSRRIPSAYPEMTVEEFLGFIAEVRGFRSAAARRAQVDRAIGLTRLDGVRRQAIETLSKGYKQRVGFAQALLHDPPALVLDEPTDGLDPHQKNEVRSLIKNMAVEKAVILSTHILEEVDAICTRVIIISQGRVVVDETPRPAPVARQPGARLDEIFRTLTQIRTNELPRVPPPIFKREFAGYFRSPVAYVFLVAFLVISVALAFSRYGGFFQAGIAGLDSYFAFFPWLFLFLVPAVGMRLWSGGAPLGDGSSFSLPCRSRPSRPSWENSWPGGPFLALADRAQLSHGAHTWPTLGSPDSAGVLATTYLGGILMAGGYLGVCSLTSALTKNQVISFVLPA